jgi:hypothetical protein
MKRCHKGFTRVDLAVTLLCAAFLIMTLGAVGNRGRRRAQQLVCASGLGKWGSAIAAYNAANDGIPTITWRAWGLFPSWMSWLPPGEYGDPPQPEMISSEWSVWKMNPYIECVDEDFQNNGQASKILACPSTDVDLMMEIIHEQWDVFNDFYFIFPSYSYWGGLAEMITISGTDESEYSSYALRELTLDTPSPRRLLMSESLYLDSALAWNYNHGANGWACAFEWLSSVPHKYVRYDGEQDATGRNQLFGDGRVQWRPISLKFEDNLPSERLDLGDVDGFREEEWNGAGSGYISSGSFDFSYY